MDVTVTVVVKVQLTFAMVLMVAVEMALAMFVAKRDRLLATRVNADGGVSASWKGRF